MLGECKMIKTKKTKAVKVVGKQKTAKVVLTATQTKLHKAGLPYARGRILNLVEYFQKHKPVDGKQYNAEVVYGNKISSIAQMGAKGQKYVRDFLGFSVKCVKEGTHKAAYKVFTLHKIK